MLGHAPITSLYDFNSSASKERVEVRNNEQLEQPLKQWVKPRKIISSKLGFSEDVLIASLVKDNSSHWHNGEK